MKLGFLTVYAAVTQGSEQLVTRGFHVARDVFRPYVV